MSITDEYSEIIETHGIKIPFIPRIIPPNKEQSLRENHYEAGPSAKLQEILTAQDRVLELGSGVGLLSAMAGLVVGGESVTAVETNPELIPVIKETHRLNGGGKIDLRNGVIVSGAFKRKPFYLRDDVWDSSMEPDSAPFKKKKHLDCLSIETLIAEKDPTVIICDIEGGEAGLFDTADLSRVRAVILTLYPEVYGAEGVETISQNLASKGFLAQKTEKDTGLRVFIRSGKVDSAVNEAGKNTGQNPEQNAEQNPEENPEPPVGKAIKPDLSGTKNRPWSPETARFLITTCMKDEGPFIIEWLAWHKSIGIEDFVIFTNDCTDGTDALLDRLQEMGQLRHLPNPAVVTGMPSFQPAALAYTPYLSEFRAADFYISMDVDEFINIGSGTGRMTDLLAATGPFDALSISELNHGSNQNEEFERGLMTELFPGHQRKAPGKRRAQRGVKTIVRRGEKLQHIRNHRPDFHNRAGDVVWLDGSGRPLESLHKESSLNGIDVRGTYDLVVLDHYPLRSLNSYLVKMFRGDVVIKNKMVSQRYWRTRDRSSEISSTFERQKPAFDAAYAALMQDKLLAELHEACCVAHEKRIAELLTQDEFIKRKQWIFDNCWEESPAESDPSKS